MSFDLKSTQQCVITGAGSGLGRALALELAKSGRTLILSDIHSQSLEETRTLALNAGAKKVTSVLGDVSNLLDVQRIADACDSPIDLVINNAGVSAEGAIGELSLDDWNWTLAVDLYGVIHGCHVFVPILKRQNRGHILNIASAAGFVSPPNMAAYNVAKAGVIALSETLSSELYGTSVGVTVLCPTFFKTNIVASARYQDITKQKIAEHLMNQGVSAEEMARLALRAVEKNKLYCIPTRQVRIMWRAKRFFPVLFRNLIQIRFKLYQRKFS